jgi:Mor family transcriptional regulator
VYGWSRCRELIDDELDALPDELLEELLEELLDELDELFADELDDAGRLDEELLDIRLDGR